MSRRVILIVLDGVGIGALPDAADYGDCGTNTLGHVLDKCGGLQLPNLSRLGLGNIDSFPFLSPAAAPLGCYGRMRERSKGKDTTTGHWEIAGLTQTEPFATYPQGFPAEIINKFTAATGLVPLGNIAASGTDILRQLGEEHLRSGRPIVYTSADSVFQIAAHEDVISVTKLYDICEKARQILNPFRVGRVIARPFLGDGPATFKRTARRHDFSMPPGGETILDRLLGVGQTVYGVGKIRDIFAGRGLSHFVYTEDNRDGMAKTLHALTETDGGLIFTNLVDFDMLYGHRLDWQGFGAALQAFDAWLPTLVEALGKDDLLLITADHGCDPTTPGTDHTREYVPLLAFLPGGTAGIPLGERQSFADIAATVSEFLGVPSNTGESFFAELGVSAVAPQVDGQQQKG